MMPPRFSEVTAALFAYRNHALHGGYEWLEEYRLRFAKRVETDGWAEWFVFSTIDNKPWMASMAEAFIEECFRLAFGMIEAFDNNREVLFNQISPTPPIANS
jgi:hypothetical protein